MVSAQLAKALRACVNRPSFSVLLANDLFALRIT